MRLTHSARHVYEQQHAARVSDTGRGDREHGLRVRPPRHGGLQESDRDGLDESLGRSELSPFRGEVEIKSSTSGEALTARDILEAQRMFEERGGGFERREDVDVQQGPLRGEQLGMDRRVNRQVMPDSNCCCSVLFSRGSASCSEVYLMKLNTLCST